MLILDEIGAVLRKVHRMTGSIPPRVTVHLKGDDWRLAKAEVLDRVMDRRAFSDAMDFATGFVVHVNGYEINVERVP